MIRVVVVGGGVAGLATAWFLTRRAPPDLALSVRVLEAAPAVGGALASRVEEGAVLEPGPVALQDGAPDTRDLVEGVGLAPRRVPCDPRWRRRLVFHEGRLLPVPASAVGLATTRLLSPRARLRLAKEPFAKAAGDHDESVAAFFARRLGPEFVSALVEPWAAATWAGDAARLSMKGALPKVALLEREHGGLLKGGLAVLRARRRLRRASGRPAGSGAFSFPTGLAEFPAAVARDLGEAVLTSCRAVTVARDGARYAVEIEGRRTETLRADVLVITTGVEAARALLDGVDADLGATLGTLPHASVAVVQATWPRAAVEHPLDAGGAWWGRGAPGGVFAVDFVSTSFPSHAREGEVNLRATLGGVFQPRLLDRDDASIRDAALEGLGEGLGIAGAPLVVRVFRRPGGAPQYTLGHLSRLAALDGKLREHPNLFLTGAAYRGASLDDCIRNGRKTASHVLRHLLTEARA